MATEKRDPVWVDPDSHTLSFLKNGEKKNGNPQPRSARKKSHVAHPQLRRKEPEIHASPKLSGPLEQARLQRLEKVELKLQEFETVDDFEQEKITRARTKSIEIYHALYKLAAEKRTRILKVLDDYEVDESILPLAIQELLQEVEYVEENV